ncbi:unnamed protein product, partial [Polarella glacialis]
AGDGAKRLRPRIPAPPVPEGQGGVDEAELRELLPSANVSSVVRLEERLALRLSEPAPFVNIDVWEERVGLLDLGSKVPNRKHLGQCYVPLEQRFNRRKCTWSIVHKGEGGHGPSTEVGFLTCKFVLATTPAPIRHLRAKEGAGPRSSELNLAWDPPVSDGGLPLRGYRIEAREVQYGFQGSGGYLDEPRTASAPPAADPSAVLKNLIGNTAYTIRVWSVNEAGPGPSAEILCHTGAVQPGVCGQPRAADDEAVVGDSTLCVEWAPPLDNGGADVVAYRVWLRPVFQDGLGNFFPSEGFIDLGLFQHQAGPRATQRAPVRLDALPACSGCLCSVAAINSRGLTGASTREAPVVWSSEATRLPQDIWEVPGGDAAPPASGDGSAAWGNSVDSDAAA